MASKASGITKDELENQTSDSLESEATSFMEGSSIQTTVFAATDIIIKPVQEKKSFSDTKKSPLNSARHQGNYVTSPTRV